MSNIQHKCSMKMRGGEAEREYVFELSDTAPRGKDNTALNKKICALPKTMLAQLVMALLPHYYDGQHVVDCYEYKRILPDNVLHKIIEQGA